MARRTAIKNGTRLWHSSSGVYLGVARGAPSRSGLVHFDGSRTRDGHPVKFAHYTEVRVSEPPKQKAETT